jgi:hypothetical protein
MTRYKGRASTRALTDFPHIVETIVPPGGLGERLNEMTGCVRGRAKARIKVKNPKAPAATRAIDGTF